MKFVRVSEDFELTGVNYCKNWVKSREISGFSSS